MSSRKGFEEDLTLKEYGYNDLRFSWWTDCIYCSRVTNQARFKELVDLFEEEGLFS